MTGKRGGADHGSPTKKHKSAEDEIASKCINAIRVLSADTVEKAKSGHPGAPMGCAPIAHILWTEFMNYSPSSPKWSARDRFVLSNGHACALLYSMLHLSGYEDMTVDQLKSFRQLGSITPGHPENFLTPGVEVTTGPLGSGISNAVGLAIAEAQMAANFNRPGHDVVDNFTYVICGDGCLQEGISSEASSLAGHLGLGKLIVCYDDNNITIDGDTSLSFSEDVNKRYEAYGWHTQTVEDVNDLHSLRAAITAAKAESEKPSMIKIRTVIGHGSTKQGTAATHGAPLGTADIEHVKKTFGFDPSQSFSIPEEVYNHYNAVISNKENEKKAWDSKFSSFKTAHPDLAREYERRFSHVLPEDYNKSFPDYDADEQKAFATRQRSEVVLNSIAEKTPEIVGGSADLSPSNLTVLKCSGDFQKQNPSGRYIRFGVREHGMAAISNGLFAYGSFRPFCATFLNFVGYALGSIRLSALSKFGVVYIMTHDSIGLGEDGPTHQPIEMLETLRSMPNLFTLRPCDGPETAGAYEVAMENPNTPSVICLSRQGTPKLTGTSIAKVKLGGYVISEFGGMGPPKLILVSTGTEVALSVKVAEKLHASQNIKVRVVSMPCCELFDKQSHSYKLETFPHGSPVMSIEASGTCGWQKYAHASCGIDSFGASAPASQLYKHYGLTEENLVEKAKKVVSFYADKHVDSLTVKPF